MSDASTVEAWQVKMCLPCGDQNFDDPAFKLRRARLLAEEFAETMSALGLGVSMGIHFPAGSATDDFTVYRRPAESKEEFLDGLCDLNWVSLGSAAELGWDFDGAFAEVARSNFSKTPAMTDGKGKLEKGPNYSPPNLADFVK